jgi:hypothetical protein
MTRSKSAFALGLALLFTALLAACSSSDDKNAYVDEINALQQDYQAEITELGVPTTLPEVRELAATASDLDAQLAADVAAVDPPEEVADLHEELIAALEDSAAVTAEVEQIVSTTRDRAELQRAIAEANRNSETTIAEFNDLIDRINEEL